MKFFVLFSLVAMTQAVQFKDCGSQTCKLTSVDVSGCASDAQSCNLVRGQTANMTVKFTTNKALDSSLKNDLEGYVSKTWVPFQNKDACPDITPACPLSSGMTATYTISVAVNKIYPTLELIIKSSMTDSTKAVCTCFEVGAKIV